MPDAAKEAGTSTPTPVPAPPAIRLWVVGLGVLAALALSAVVPWLRIVLLISPVGSYLAILPVVLTTMFFVARMINPRETLLLGSMLALACAVGGGALAGSWRGTLFLKPALERNVDYRPVNDAVPSQLSLPNKAGADEATIAFLDGSSRGGQKLADLPWAVILRPMMWTGMLILGGLAMVFGLIAFTSRQWTHHERLQHPLLQVPEALSERSLWRQRGFWIALAVVGLYWAWNLTATWKLHTLPLISNEFRMAELYKLLHMEQPAGWPTQIMTSYWGAVKIFPMIIGIAFLLNLELGFSVWSGYWFGVVIFGWIYAAGFPVVFEQHGRLVGCGATVAMAALILWMGRIHYLALLKAAIGWGRSEDDRVGVWGARVLILACLGVGGFTAWLGAGWGAIIGLILVLSYMLTIARVVAEAGLPSFQAAHEMSLFAYSIGLPLVMPYRAIICMLWLGQGMIVDTRENVAGFAAQVAGVSERQGMRTGWIIGGFGLLAVACVAIAIISYTAVSWTAEIASLPNPAFAPKDLTGKAAEALSGNGSFAASLLGSPAMVGVLLVVAVAVLRRFWVGFPFNPLGLVVAFSWPIFLAWGSLMLGWLAKVLVLRYGGVNLYRQVKPVAIGIIFGDLCGYCIQYTFFGISKARGAADFPIWLNLP